MTTQGVLHCLIPFFLCKMKAFISCLKKKKFQESESKWKKGTETVPDPWNPIMPIRVALWGEVRRPVKSSLFMAPSQGPSFPGGETIGYNHRKPIPQEFWSMKNSVRASLASQADFTN